MAVGPTGMSITVWVAPAAAFLDRMEATERRWDSIPNGRVRAFITSSTGEWLIRPFQAMQPPAASTVRRISSGARSTRASTSIASAVPAAEVIAREEVLGIVSPAAAAIGTTTMLTLVPGMPPRECLSATTGAAQRRRRECAARLRARATVSPSSRLRAAATRKAAISRPA